MSSGSSTLYGIFLGLVQPNKDGFTLIIDAIK